MIEGFSDTAKKLLPAKKREISELEFERCEIIDRYVNDENLKLYLIFFDFTSGYTQLTKEVNKMVRIMGIGGKRNRSIGMSVLPLEEVKIIPILDVYEFKNIKCTGLRTMVSCPFHEDYSPSMLIDTKNRFKCFSCQKSGTVIDFVMELTGLDFVSAVKNLQGLKK